MMLSMNSFMSTNVFLLLTCRTEDGVTRLDVQMDGETLLLGIAQMADLFKRDRSVIT